MIASFIELAIHIMPSLLQGALVTIEVSLLSMAFAVAIGMLVAMVRYWRIPVLSQVLRVYVEVWRATPLVVQLLMLYFSLPDAGINLSPFVAGTLGLSLNLGAYLSEVFRAAIKAVGKGQEEAGLSLGLKRWVIFRTVVMPQALMIALPTLGGYFISLLKDSSLVSFISMNDLLRRGTIEISTTFRTMEIYLIVAILYCTMSFVAAYLSAYLERKITPAHLRGEAARKEKRTKNA